MPDSPAGDRLSALDALFVYLEKKEMPLHIGSVSVFDGPLPIARLQSLVEAKLPLISRYRQRILFSPFNIGHPTWEWDPDFDLKQHFYRARLKDGTNQELETFAGHLFGQIMDRNRPLWDMTVVEGLEGGRSALIARVHHCLVDGVSGVALMNLLLDKTPKPPRLPKKQPFEAPPLPDAATRFLSAMLTSYGELANRILAVQKDALDVLSGLMSEAPLSSLDQLPGAMPFWMVERLPFNKPVLGPRKLAWTEFPLSEFKEIAKSQGVKLNDIALTLVTAAVRQYCELHGHSMKGRSMRVMVPVNLRANSELQSFGNQISLIPVQASLDIADPLDLLHAIHKSTDLLKHHGIAGVVALGAKCLSILPIPLQAAFGTAAGNVLPLPPWNMVCTNVPGPQIPLYLLGRKMLTYYPYVPIGNDMGLCCAMESYNGNMYFNFSADSAAVPDADRLRDLLVESYSALKQRAGIGLEANPPVRRPRRKRSTPAVVVQAAEATVEQTVPVVEEPAVPVAIPAVA